MLDTFLESGAQNLVMAQSKLKNMKNQIASRKNEKKDALGTLRQAVVNEERKREELLQEQAWQLLHLTSALDEMTYKVDHKARVEARRHDYCESDCTKAWRVVEMSQYRLEYYVKKFIDDEFSHKMSVQERYQEAARKKQEEYDTCKRELDELGIATKAKDMEKKSRKEADVEAKERA